MIPEINLLPKSERQSSSFLIIFISFLIVWLICLSIIVYQYIHTKNEKKLADTRIENLKMDKEILETQVENQKNGQSGSLEEAVAKAEELTAPTSHLIEELLELLPNHSYLSHYEYENKQLSIQTQFESLDVAASYVAKLVSSPLFTNVRIKEIKTFTFEEASEEQADEEMFKEIPRYDVNIILETHSSALEDENGGEEDE
ncbi:PilN domain-containing protein [Aeribacillus sp. FSL M8-0254]|uniref:PilN domain-containing protein n=1 Tax=Aeribacillus sp. FSL M8-0254 TaxID=2954577 RepID=UPI0030FA86FB